MRVDMLGHYTWVWDMATLTLDPATDDVLLWPGLLFWYRLVLLPKKLDTRLEGNRGLAMVDSGPGASGLNICGGRPSSVMLGLGTVGGGGGSIMI